MKKFNLPKAMLALFLAIIMSFSSLLGAYGAYYKEANPEAVNEGLSESQIEQKDLAAFSDTSGYDYHNSTPDDYAPNELILEVISSDTNATSTISSFADSYNLGVKKVIKTEEMNDKEDYTSLASVDSKNDKVVITSYFVTTKENDIISLCDNLNKNDEVFNAQPNFKYEICEENNVNLAQDEIASYSEPKAFSTTPYQSNLQWWFDYCNVSTAWKNYADSSTGYGMGAGVTVAVIDTGCNTNHEDIVDNLWSYPSDKTKCGYYAYGNSYIAKNDSTVDVNGHGSHCCGTIAMSGDNSVGGIGTAPKCSLMVMKADRNTGKGTFYDTEIIECLEKSASLGADIISMSLGGYSFSYSTFRTYQKVSSSCLILCAAGNDSFDTSEKLFFPASASCNMGIMALNSSSSKTKLAYFSNTDTSGNFYKVVAPGTDIWSLDYSKDNGYCMKNGTSMATPATAGMVASYMSYIKNIKGWNWTPAQYQYKIESTIGSSSNPITCTAYSATTHAPAYKANSQFPVMNLDFLISKSTSNTFSSTSAISFNNSTVLSGVTNATGLTASQLDKYALMRVSLMYWSLSTTRNGITDYSDLSKLTGLNYLDLSSSKSVSQSNLSTVISNCAPTLCYFILNPSTDLTDISCLSSAPFSNLYYLDISSNAISSIGAISKFTSLRYLYASSNSITDISALGNMTHIELIDLNNNTIQDPTPAFASKYLANVNLSHNKISDYNTLYQYKGAYVDSDFYSDTITFNVSYNYMPDLTATIASDIKSNITKNNTNDSGTLYATTINFTYSNQSSGSFTPMTSFYIKNTTVTREAFSSGNLNTYALTGFTAYPSSVDQYKYLNWTCDEPGYCNPDGTISVTADKITSCRTLKFTATAPQASSATSTSNKTKTQSIYITITAPETYNAYLSDRVVKTGTSTRIIVSTNSYTSKLVLRSGTTASATDYVIYDLSTATNVSSNANDKCKTYLLDIPSTITATTGTYPLYLYSADSKGNYSVGSSNDISGYSTYAYKALGSLYVKDSPNTSSAISVTANSYVNRYGESVIFATNAGTSSTSSAKSSGSYSFGISYSQYIGSGSIYTDYGSGYTGKTATSYPNSKVGTSSINLTLTDSNSNKTSASASVTTVAPEVKTVTGNNTNTYSSDGYVEYLVKTNNATTGIKTVVPETTTAVSSESELIMTSLSSTSSYAYYSTSSSYKMWKLRVPLSSGSIQPVTIIAYDNLGNGSVTKTPASGIQAGSYAYIYPDSSSYSKTFVNDLKFLPIDSNGESLADCCKSVTYSLGSTKYFTLNSSSTGKVTCDMQYFLTNYTGSEPSRVAVKATLENGATSSTYIYAYRPYVASITYDAATSNRAPGGKVYYTAKTYGSDSINISTSSYTSDVFLTLTKDDTDYYTTETDENSNKYILWKFTREFDHEGTKLLTYARSSYKFSDTINANSYSYSYHSLTSQALGDYTLWNEQTARLTDENLAELLKNYGDNTTQYNTYLSAVNDYKSNAVLNFDISHQSEIDAQTLNFKSLVDTLFGYDAYNEIINKYNEMITLHPDYYYIPDRLSELLKESINDSNVKAVSNEIESLVNNLEAKADTTRWETAIASIPSDLESIIKVGSSYYIYSPTAVSEIKTLKVIPFKLPIPISKQAELDKACENLENAVLALSGNMVDVTPLQNILENEEKYNEIISNYTLPDSLAIDYANSILEIRNNLKLVADAEEVNNLVSKNQEITSKIDEFKTAIDELREYLDDISNDENVPALKESPLTNILYSDETYTPLKEKYNEILALLENKNSGYKDTVSARKSLSEIKLLFGELHTHQFTTIIGETCTYKYMKCECGEYVKLPYSDEESKNHSHSWGSAVTFNAPLCDGSTSFSYHICNVCGAVEYLSNSETLTFPSHHWVEKGSPEISETADMISESIVNVMPTCTKNGSKVYVCKDCGAFYTEDIAPLDHDYSGEWVITTPPSERSNGEETNTCTRCDSKITRTIPALPARVNFTVPFTAGNYSAKGMIVKAYAHGANFTTDEPLYTFSENADIYGYKINIDEQNHTLTIRLPQHTSYDLVISKVSHTSCEILNLKIDSTDINITEYNLQNPDKTLIAVLHAGDINGDNKINALDKVALKPNLGKELSEETERFELNNDSLINSDDMNLLLKNYMLGALSFTFN